MVARSRSPNYPNLTLGEAIDFVRKVYHAKNRSKFGRETLAGYLGYSGLSGAAISRIGAIRSYGLIEGGGEALAVSGRAVTILEAPTESEDYIYALNEAFIAPSVFKRIIRTFGDEVVNKIEIYTLLKKIGFSPEAADKALSCFLSGQKLANAAGVANNKIYGSINKTINRNLSFMRASASKTIKPHEVEAVDNYGAKYKIQLSRDRWMLVQILGGEPMPRDFISLEKFARFQRELLDSSTPEKLNMTSSTDHESE